MPGKSGSDKDRKGAPPVTRHLARLADISYRRRGRMVLAWIVATVVIIGVGSSLAGEYNADYNTPGSESKAASVLTEERFGGYSGQEIYVVWKDPSGAQSAAAKERVDAFLAKAQQVDHVAKPTEVRVSQDGKIGSTTLPLTVAGWDVPKADGEKLIAAAEENSGDGLQIKLGGDPIYAAQEAASPEGLGFLGAAIVLLIAFGSVVAAGLPLLIALFGLGISSGGLIVLLANVVDVPDWTTAVSGLIGIGVGIDYALLGGGALGAGRVLPDDVDLLARVAAEALLGQDAGGLGLRAGRVVVGVVLAGQRGADADDHDGGNDPGQHHAAAPAVGDVCETGEMTRHQGGAPFCLYWSLSSGHCGTAHPARPGGTPLHRGAVIPTSSAHREAFRRHPPHRLVDRGHLAHQRA